jgi:ParB-like chromosome segregation protein Spo0J
MNEIKQPVVRSLARVMEWEINPRRGVYRGMEELKASILREGLQDAIHVWERVDADLLLKGHRRTRAMKELGWTECLQVVHHFADEREAFAFLLEDHGHTVPLDAEEKIVAIETGVKLGMTTADLAPMMGVTEERAQLWFDLGEMLPTGARSALARGDLSVNTAELLLLIFDPKKRREASTHILNDPETGEPMAHGQAKAFIQARYVLPEKWHKDWLELEAKLRKKKKVVDGFNYVEWKDRLDFVLGDSGQPQPEFELGESYYPKDAEGRNWEQVAVGLQVPVYVCAAPRHAEGFVTLVNAAMMRDALSVPRAPVQGEEEDEESETGRELGRHSPEFDRAAAGVVGMDRVQEMLVWLSANPAASPWEILHYFGLSYVAAETVWKAWHQTDDKPKPDDIAPVVGASEQTQVSLVDDKQAERLRVWLKTWLGAIYEHLVSKPTDAMTSGPWKPLYAFLAHLTTDVDAGALEAWRGIASHAEALEFINSDVKQRAPLRLAILLLLCAESDASDQPEKVIREVAGALGLDGTKLDHAAEVAAGK